MTMTHTLQYTHNNQPQQFSFKYHKASSRVQHTLFHRNEHVKTDAHTTHTSVIFTFSAWQFDCTEAVGTSAGWEWKWDNAWWGDCVSKTAVLLLHQWLLWQLTHSLV